MEKTCCYCNFDKSMLYILIFTHSWKARWKRLKKTKVCTKSFFFLKHINSGLGGDISREDIKEKLKTDFEVNIDKESGDIAFITYQIGEPEAKVTPCIDDIIKNVFFKRTRTKSLYPFPEFHELIVCY